MRSKKDLDLIRAILNENPEAFDLASTGYLEDFRQSLQATHGMFRDFEFEAGFRFAFKDLEVKISASQIYFSGADVHGLGENSVLNYFESIGGNYLKNLCRSREKTPEDYDLVKGIQEGSQRAINKAYQKLKIYFRDFARKRFSRCSDELVTDVFQDVMIVLIEKFIQKGRIRVEGDLLIGLRNNATIKTLIVGIGKRMLSRRCQSNEVPTDPEDMRNLLKDTQVMEEAESQYNFDVLIEAYKQLQQRSKQILYLKYWLNLKMEDITTIIGSPSAQATRTRATRSRHELREHYDQIISQRKN